MAEVSEDDLKGAIAATQKDIFATAWDQEEAVEDDTGDRSREEMGEGLEGQIEEDDAEVAAKEAEADSKTEPDPAEPDKEPVRDDKGKFTKDEKTEPEKATEPEAKPGKDHRVPVGELKSEREKRQAAETELARIKTEREAERASAQSELARINARLDAMSRSAPTPPEPARKIERPDMFADPDGYAKWQDDRNAEQLEAVKSELTNRFVEGSLAAAHERHGEKFATAYNWAAEVRQASPQTWNTVWNTIRNAPNPGAALMAEYGRVQTLREVGTDPAAYREKVAAETREALMKDPDFRKQLLEDLKAEAGTANNGRPRTITRLPSLNGASGTGATQDGALDGSQRAIFASAFED